MSRGALRKGGRAKYTARGSEFALESVERSRRLELADCNRRPRIRVSTPRASAMSNHSGAIDKPAEGLRHQI